MQAIDNTPVEKGKDFKLKSHTCSLGRSVAVIRNGFRGEKEECLKGVKALLTFIPIAAKHTAENSIFM